MQFSVFWPSVASELYHCWYLAFQLSPNCLDQVEDNLTDVNVIYKWGLVDFGSVYKCAKNEGSMRGLLFGLVSPLQRMMRTSNFSTPPSS